MTVEEYTTLQDDGCPNCPDHITCGPGYAVVPRGQCPLADRLSDMEDRMMLRFAAALSAVFGATTIVRLTSWLQRPS